MVIEKAARPDPYVQTERNHRHASFASRLSSRNAINSLDRRASLKEVFRTLISEKGEKGQGSASPVELIWKKPRPAARQPPDSSSSPGKEHEQHIVIIVADFT